MVVDLQGSHSENESEAHVDSMLVSLTLSLHQVYLTEKNLKLFFYPILRGLAESNHKLQHSFSKYQFAIILKILRYA